LKELATMEKNWTNYGDVNPIEHGGVFVMQEDGTTFRIVKLQFVDDEGKNLLTDLHVDVSDTWIEKEAVGNFADLNEASEDYNVQLAIACTDYYDPANFGCDGKFVFLTLEDSEEYLKRFGITNECFR
jgi:hypothetical protein